MHGATGRRGTRPQGSTSGARRRKTKLRELLEKASRTPTGKQHGAARGTENKSHVREAGTLLERDERTQDRQATEIGAPRGKKHGAAGRRGTRPQGGASGAKRRKTKPLRDLQQKARRTPMGKQHGSASETENRARARKAGALQEQ